MTGATGVIGNSILDKLVSAGANILATGTNEQKLKIIKDKHKDLNTVRFDISDHGKIDQFVENCSKNFSNKIDVLINNAGITQDNLSLRMKEDEWKRVIDINLTSTFLISKSVIKKMLKSKSGKIINVTSVVGHTGNIGQANYAASKAGIIAFSKSLAIEYAKKNININCISPGFIKTDMTDKINDDFKKTLIGKIPSGDLGTGEDVSNCVAFLASDMAKYVNGETLHVNGGMYMA